MKKRILKYASLLLIVLSSLLLITSCGKVEKISIDYKTMTYVGTSLKDFSTFFDEQDASDPMSDNAVKYSIGALDSNADGSIDEKDAGHPYEVTVDLGKNHKVSYIYVYYPKAGYKITFQTGAAFNYDKEFTLESSVVGWNKVEIGDKTRYINVVYPNGQAPSEILIYGKGAVGGSTKTYNKAHETKPMGYFLGANGNQSDIPRNSYNFIKFTPYLRDYINWAWFYERSYYPVPGTTFTSNMNRKYISMYTMLKTPEINVDAVPCFMFGNEVAIEGIDKNLPEAYAMYGELLHQVTLRFGNNAMNTEDMVYLFNKRAKKELNGDFIHWIEAGNEPNGEGNDGFTPYELAALTSCAYDGHCSTVTSPNGSGIGVKTADPNMKMAMAGLAGVGTRYIQAMTFWMEHNRADGEIAMDAFNVHTYCRKTVEYNGYTISYGVCPEEGGITDYVKELTAWRDKYYPDTEVWVTEFGWDTNTSYETENACHPYGEFSARELQAMWLVRAYFMFASVGVDRCAMYMCSDLGDDETSTGKYGTSGVIAYDGTLKESYYYIYTIRNTMSDMYFAEVIDSGNENVWIYRFENGEGKSCYAVWCPTMDSVTVDDYVLEIDGKTATLTEFVHEEISGVSTSLDVNNKTVTVDVSERPVLIFSE